MIPYAILAIEDENDRTFAEELYVAYRRLMYSEIQKITKNSWDTEDVMQSVIEKLIDRLQLLRTLDRTHQINFIITVSRNTAISLLRQRNRASIYSFDETFDSDGSSFDAQNISPEDQVLQNLDAESIQTAWKSLPIQVQELLNAKYVLDLSDNEIAKTLGIKPSSVRMTLTRARRIFREHLSVVRNDDIIRIY